MIATTSGSIDLGGALFEVGNTLIYVGNTLFAVKTSSPLFKPLPCLPWVTYTA